jgi:hypothetical protein
MSGQAVRPLSPERRSVLRVDRAAFEEGDRLTVTVTVAYEPWCRSGPHEMTDAVVAVTETLAAAREDATRTRLATLASGRDAPGYPYPGPDDA